MPHRVYAIENDVPRVIWFRLFNVSHFNHSSLRMMLCVHTKSRRRKNLGKTTKSARELNTLKFISKENQTHSKDEMKRKKKYTTEHQSDKMQIIMI